MAKIITSIKAFLLTLLLVSASIFTNAQSVDQMIAAYTGNVSWNSVIGRVTFESTGSMNFPNRELLYNNAWTVPEIVKHIVINEDVTVTGEFYFEYDCTLEGKNWETSRIFGTNEQNYLDQSRGFSAVYVSFYENKKATLHVKRLTSLNPKVYHFTTKINGVIHMDSCRVIDDRGGRFNNSDGFQASHGSTVRNSYFETGEDVLKIYSDNLFENVTIKMIEFAVPIQCGWGDYGSGITATIRNLRIIGDEGRAPENAIIEARQGSYTKNIIIDGLTVENPNAAMYRFNQPTATINVTIENADIKLKKFGDIIKSGGTRTICGTTEQRLVYNCIEDEGGVVTSIKNHVLDDVTFYLNPVNNSLFVNHSGIEKVHLTVYNLQGKHVMQKVFFSQNESIDLSALNAGVYVVRIQRNGESRVDRLLVK